MENKLSWDPPKWKSYSFDGNYFKVELETGEVYTGKSDCTFISMAQNHPTVCRKIFGQNFSVGHTDALVGLSRVLELTLSHGHWPEYHNVAKFLDRYYERVAKIGNSNKFTICIETEFEIIPKFTL